MSRVAFLMGMGVGVDRSNNSFIHCVETRGRYYVIFLLFVVGVVITGVVYG